MQAIVSHCVNQCLSQLCCKTHFFFFSFFSHDVSLLRFPTELKGLGADFVFGFVQSMDGERDPRNLLLAFQIAKNLIHGGYDLGENIIISSHVTTSVFLSISDLQLTLFLPQ